MGRFDGKVVIVTGGSSGIGESTAIAFAKEGANLTITGRNQERLFIVAEKCRDAGAKVLELVCSMEDFDVLEPIITKTVETFGAINILVNNAATVHVGGFELVDLHEYNRVVELNLRAPVFLSKYALPHLRKTEGCIVNVSSTSSISALPGIVLYSMTKAALDHFTRAIASEFAKDKVRINCVNPGVVAPTRIFDGILSDEETKGMRREILTRQPLGLLHGGDIAKGIMYLCEAQGVTGTTLVIDGGLLLS